MPGTGYHLLAAESHAPVLNLWARTKLSWYSSSADLIWADRTRGRSNFGLHYFGVRVVLSTILHMLEIM